MLCSPLFVRGSSSHHLSLSRSWETIFYLFIYFLRSYFRSMVAHRGYCGHLFLSMTKNHKCLISLTAFLIYPSHLLSLYLSLSSSLCLGSCCQHLSQKNKGRGGWNIMKLFISFRKAVGEFTVIFGNFISVTVNQLNSWIGSLFVNVGGVQGRKCQLMSWMCWQKNSWNITFILVNGLHYTPYYFCRISHLNSNSNADGGGAATQGAGLLIHISDVIGKYRDRS